MSMVPEPFMMLPGGRPLVVVLTLIFPLRVRVMLSWVVWKETFPLVNSVLGMVPVKEWPSTVMWCQ